MSCSYDAFVSGLGFALIFCDCVVFKLAMHSLTGASRPRLSEKEPTCFVFETSCYAFGGLCNFKKT